MKTASVYIWSPSTISGGYSSQLYFSFIPLANKLRTGDILTDTNSNQYSVTRFYNPSNPSETNLNSLFSDGWRAELEYITSDVIPQEDTDYNSTIESPVIPNYLPEVSWEANIDNINASVPAYNYQCNVSANSASDPGSGEVEVGYYLVDEIGSIFEIKEVISASSPISIRVYDISEEDDGSPFAGLGYVYQTKRSAFGMSQAKYYRLNQSARDKANNIEKAIIWENRGVELLTDEFQYKNITKLDIFGINYLNTIQPGWNGGFEFQGKTSIGNNIIQGRCGFESHELDGSNNDVNSYIEWNSIDRTHYHRVAPQIDFQDLNIKIGFQFPSYFEGLRETENAIEFYGKADNGSGDGVNQVTLTSLVDTDGTEYVVSGKNITSSNRNMISLTKNEIDSILNPITSSSSSASAREWNTGDAGKIVYAKFVLSGNLGDNIYLDANNVFMYL